MPSTFPFDPSMIPIVQTRKALLILDLQNDFLSDDGALQTQEPEGFLERTLDLAKAFRNSGAGDVIWVRSEFEAHRSLLGESDQILTVDAISRSQKKPARGRNPTSSAHDCAVMEADEEAFLSISEDGDKKPCVRKGTIGAAFAPEVQAAIVAGRDIVVTKSHYSAFASERQQLVQLLRGRFVTELYVCGALTNISIYATALDAGRHGYEMTIVEDCCGFRSTMRHLNAIRQLVQLTGCEVVGCDALLDQVRPATPPSQATGLSPCISKIGLGLGGGSPPDADPAPAPRTLAASPHPGRDKRKRGTPPPRSPSNQGRPEADTKRPLKDMKGSTADLEAPSPDSESLHSPEKKSEEADRKVGVATAMRSELASPKGPTQDPGASSAKAEKPRIRTRVRQRVPRPSSDKKATSPPPSEKTSPSKAKPEATVPITSPEPKSEPKPPHNMADDQATPISSEPLCEGDTTIITNVLSPDLAANAFERLLDEVSWAGMSHMGGEVPRRIAVQGAIADDGSMPVYRHPADESPPLLPFSPTVLQIKDEVEKQLGHPLNHVLIQHYRTGNDYISEHSDKTLDIVPGSFIANVSLGAERTMVFRTKRPPKDKGGSPAPQQSQNNNKDDQPQTQTPEDTGETAAEKAARKIQRAPLPHNSLCRMGLATNMRWLHAIRQDKRADRDKSPAELSHAGARISLTFRHIGTFINDSQTLIWGQGAVSKTREGAGKVVNGQTDEAVRMLQAFGRENHASEFDWEAMYGGGFDVLHMGTPKRVCVSAGGDPVGNVRVALALAELGVACARGSVEGEVRFEDNDVSRAVVEGDGSVLRYLDAVYGVGRRYDQLLPGEVAKMFGRLQAGLDLLGKWRGVSKAVGVGGEVKPATEEETVAVKQLLKKELAVWEGFASEAAAAAAKDATKGDTDAPASTDGDKDTKEDGSGFYIAGGNQPSPADFALWPVLHDMVRVCGEGVLGEHLRKYYAAFKQRSAAAKALGQSDAKAE